MAELDERQHDGLTDATVELLQVLIRNRCVNDGTETSGEEVRNADVLQQVIAGPDVDVDRYEAAPGRVSIVGRIAGSDPDAPSLCLMGHTDVVPVNESGWSEDPFGGDIIDGPDGPEVWGRGAVDMLNLTASMAVTFRSLADSGFRPSGDLIFFGVADEEAGSAYGARWMADHHRDAIKADYVLTESGGLHSGPAEAPFVGINIAEKGVAWRRLRVTGTPGHGSAPFRRDNALVKAAGVIQRLHDYRPAPRFHELWGQKVEALGLPDDMRAALLDPSAIDELLDTFPSAAAASHFHACTHTTFSPNLVDGSESGGGRMKVNVIPDTVVIDVDIDQPPRHATVGQPATGGQRAVPDRPPHAAVRRRVHRRPDLPRDGSGGVRGRAVQPIPRLQRIRLAVPRPQRTHRHRVARPDHPSVPPRRHRPPRLSPGVNVCAQIRVTRPTGSATQTWCQRGVREAR